MIFVGVIRTGGIFVTASKPKWHPFTNLVKKLKDSRKGRFLPGELELIRTKTTELKHTEGAITELNNAKFTPVVREVLSRLGGKYTPFAACEGNGRPFKVFISDKKIFQPESACLNAPFSIHV